MRPRLRDRAIVEAVLRNACCPSPFDLVDPMPAIPVIFAAAGRALLQIFEKGIHLANGHPRSDLVARLRSRVGRAAGLGLGSWRWGAGLRCFYLQKKRF